MTAKEKVLKVYPGALYAWMSGRIYSRSRPFGHALSGEFADERRAWADAWRRIQAAKKEAADGNKAS